MNATFRFLRSHGRRATGARHRQKARKPDREPCANLIETALRSTKLYVSQYNRIDVTICRVCVETPPSEYREQTRGRKRTSEWTGDYAKNGVQPTKRIGLVIRSKWRLSAYGDVSADVRLQLGIYAEMFMFV